MTIFSQWGNPTHVNLIKDRESGKLRGFAYLKYEDQRSCVLAVDNFNGVLIYEKPLKVDHTYFQLREGQEEEDFAVDYSEVMKEQPKIEAPKKRKTERKEIEAAKDLPSTSSVFVADDDDFNDPMADMLKRTFEEKDDKEHNSKHRNKKRKSRSREDQKTEDAKGAA